MRWSRVPPVSDTPSPRYGHSAVTLNSSDGWSAELVVVYGGTAKLPSQRTVMFGDLMVFRVADSLWGVPEMLSEMLPPPRAFHCAVAVQSQMYVFGGHIVPLDQGGNQQHTNPIRTYFNDIWCLDMETWKWHEIQVTEEWRPAPRDLSQIVHIGGSKLLVFGGRSDSGKVLNDLWGFDIAKKRWTHIQPPGPTPGVRMKHAFVYAQGHLLLYGGENSSGSFYDDVWHLQGLDGDHWQWSIVKLRPKPPGRSGHSIAVCDTYIVCFGGHISASGLSGVFSRSHHYSGDLWLLDLRKGRWSKLAGNEEESPGPRVCPSLLRVQDGRFLLFGGRDKDAVYAETWWLEIDPADSSPQSPSAMSVSSMSSSVAPSVRGSLRNRQISFGNQVAEFWANVVPSFVTSSAAQSSTAKSSPQGSFLKEIVRYTSTDSFSFQHDTAAMDLAASNADFQSIRQAFGLDSHQETLMDCVSTTGADLDEGLSVIGKSKGNQADNAGPVDVTPQSVRLGRLRLSRCSPANFPLGNVWLLLGDYHRLLEEVDILKIWKDAGPRAHVGFGMHLSLSKIRLADIAGVLSEYKLLVDP